MTSNDLSGIRALVFDIIGTTTDWHSPVQQALEVVAAKKPGLPPQDWSKFAHEWRQGYFDYCVEQRKRKPEEKQYVPIGKVFTYTLDTLSARKNINWHDKEKEELIKSWSEMKAWEDTAEGLAKLRTKYIVSTLTNGATRTTIDVSRRCGMTWDAVLTSDILHDYKPSDHMYQSTLMLLGTRPEETAMIAAHAVDLAAASKNGFRTFYITRPTEDRDVDLANYSFDLVIGKGGLLALARELIGDDEQ